MSEFTSQSKGLEESLIEADAYFKANELAKARQLYVQFLKELLALYPENHPQTLACMEKLGDTCNALGNWGEAARIFRSVIAIKDRNSIQDDQLVSLLLKAAQALDKLDQPDDAQIYYNRAAVLERDSSSVVTKVQEQEPGPKTAPEPEPEQESEPIPSKLAQEPFSLGEEKIDNACAESKHQKPDQAPTDSPPPVHTAVEVAPLHPQTSPKGSRRTASKLARLSASKSLNNLAPFIPDEEVLHVDTLAQQLEKKKSAAATRTSMAAVEPKLDHTSPVTGKRTLYMVCGFVVLVSFVAFILTRLTAIGGTDSAQGPLYSGKEYKTADFLQALSFGKSSADLVVKKHHYHVLYKAWTGSMADELAFLKGSFDRYQWLRDKEEGLITEDGGIFFDKNGPDYAVINEMWDISKAAQKYYAKTGRYPRHTIKDASHLQELMPKLSYENAFSHAQSPPKIIEIPWPNTQRPGISAGDQTDLEQSWQTGTLLNSRAQPNPGDIFCAQLGYPDVPDADNFNVVAGSVVDGFYIEGFDHNGELFKGLNGNAFLIVLKKGIDCTHETASSLAPQTTDVVPFLCIAKEARANKLLLLLKYFCLLAVPVVAIGVLLTRKHAMVLWKMSKLAKKFPH